jgi:hypothetical protein
LGTLEQTGALILLGRVTTWFSTYLGFGLRISCLDAIREGVLSGKTARGPAVAIQCIEDPFYLAWFSAFRSKAGIDKQDVYLIATRSIVSGTVGRAWWYRFLHAATLGRMTGERWLRTYSLVGSKVGYRCFTLADVLSGVGDWFRSRRIARTLPDRGDFSSLEILGVQVGDLVIDTYLRFRPSPRIDAEDSFFTGLLWQAHRDIRRAQRFFESVRPRLYVTAYSTYIDHGIPVRVALRLGIPVRSFGNFTQIGKLLTRDDWFHTPDTSAYRRDFDALGDSQNRRLSAQAQLKARLAGKVDAATSYMKVSAYADSANPPPAQVNGAVVVFLHDFYDSPHVYADLIFPDFWSWICFTIDTLASSGQRFFLKPHPNQVDRSRTALEELQQAYPNIEVLPVSTTNVQLVDAGMICGVTMYGTVAHELAFLGVNSIACARHPHHAFDFCRTAHTVEQYHTFLSTPRNSPLTASQLREQALEFFYMHNIHGEDGQLELRRRFVESWKAYRVTAADSNEIRHLTSALHECQALSELAHIPLRTPSCESMPMMAIRARAGQ